MNTNESLKNGPRFDWMQKTVKEDPEEVYDGLAGALGAELEKGRGLNGYHHSMAVKKSGETLAKVLYGGPNGWPNVITSGSATDLVEPILRDAWERQEVTRMDSAQDFDEVGGYERVAAALAEITKSSQLNKNTIESVVRGIRSRTMYVGAASSRVRVRLYEKGMFEQQLGNPEAPASWFRMELQVRPTGQAARIRATEMDAAEAWGFSRWAQELALEVIGLDVERVTMQPKRDPDYERAVSALIRQYTGILQEVLKVEGSWDAVGRLLGVLK